MSILCTYTPSLSFSSSPCTPFFFHLLSLVFVNTTQLLQVDYCMHVYMAGDVLIQNGYMSKYNIGAKMHVLVD